MKKYKILISNYTYADYNKSQILLTALDKYKNSFVLLFNDGWNDMGFYSEFFILYVDNKAVCKQIGLVKLCNKKMKLDNVYPYSKINHFLKNDTLIERELSSNILNDYYSIIGMSTYNRLLGVLKDDIEVNKFIFELHEVSTLSNDTINEIKNYDWFKDSILRDFNISERENVEIVALTELKNKLKIENTSYHFSTNFEDLLGKPSHDNLKTIYEWLENTSFYISFNLANKIVNITKQIINNYTNNDMPFKILKLLKLKFESYTDFVEKIDSILNENKSFYESINNIESILKVTEEDLSNLELGHYTSLSTVSKLINIDDSHLRLTNGRQMNDPFEGKNLLEYIFGDSHSDWRPTKRFITSLTTVQDSLPMWNNYAEGATGAMLIYDKTYLMNISKLNYVGIYKVVYISPNSEENKIEIKSNNLLEKDKVALVSEINNLKDLFESETKNLNSDEKEEKKRVYLNKLQEIDFLFKKSDYSYEVEYRIVANTENKNTKLEVKVEENQLLNFPFLYCYLKSYKIKYSKLLLGPKSVSIDYVAPYVNHCDESIKIEVSKINFR